MTHFALADETKPVTPECRFPASSRHNGRATLRRGRILRDSLNTLNRLAYHFIVQNPKCSKIPQIQIDSYDL